MKNGKFINLGYYNNVKMGYGTVDYKNLKTIYIKINSWLEPECELKSYDNLLLKTKRKLKSRVTNLKSDLFKKESIIDLDIKTRGIKMGKRTFLNLDLTLFTEKTFDIKSKETKIIIKDLIKNTIDNDLDDKNLFNFHKNKI